MSVIAGYVNAPPNDPAALAIDLQAVTAVLYSPPRTIYWGGPNPPASCILTKIYYPVGNSLISPRESFNSGVPYKCGPGMSLVLNLIEVVALVEAGAATFS